MPTPHHTCRSRKFKSSTSINCKYYIITRLMYWTFQYRYMTLLWQVCWVFSRYVFLFMLYYASKQSWGLEPETRTWVATKVAIWDLRLACDLLVLTWDFTWDLALKTWDLLEIWLWVTCDFTQVLKLWCMPIVWHCEWVSSFLTAHQHIIGYSVP